MKKAAFALVLITASCCVFICGFLIGRNMNRSNIQISTSEHTSGSSSHSETAPKRVNINTASLEELTLLPGIGKVLAQRIIDYRETVSPFRTVSDLCNVEGIGDQKMLAIIDYITT